MTTATPRTFFNSQFLHTVLSLFSLQLHLFDKQIPSTCSCFMSNFTLFLTNLRINYFLSNCYVIYLLQHFRNNNNNICTLTTKISYVKSHRSEFLPPLCATLKGSKGFGPSPKKKKIKTKKLRKDNNEEEDKDEEEEEEGIIPEIVTNRMISRMGFTVGIPLGIGILFFPFFYYLKVGLKIDVPTWVPFIFSFFFFGSALLGVSYGIVSSSWDPLREGSLLGWTEAQKNWPVFWQSLRGGGSRKS